MPLKKTPTPYTQRLRLMKLFGFCVLLLLVALAGHEPASFAIDSPAQLAPNSIVSRKISPGATDVFEITIEQDNVLRFSIDKGDLRLATSVYGPTGAKLFEHISQGLEIVEVALPADMAGNYRIELQSREKGSEQRSYELKVEPFPIVTPALRKDSEARLLLAEAEVLRANWKEYDLRLAKANFDHAANIWESLSDFSNAATATLKAADVCFRVSEFNEALTRHKNAAVFATKAGNSVQQARALSRAGIVYSYLGNNQQGQNYVARAFNLLNFAATASDPLVRVAYGEALSNMAEVSYSKGDFAKAFEQFKKASAYLHHDREAQAKMHRFKGYISGSRGLATPAETLSEISRALYLSRAINDKAGEGQALTLLGLFRAYTGKKHEGLALHNEALEIFRTIGDRHSAGLAHNGLSQTYQILNDLQNAIISAETAQGLFESIGALDSVAVNTFKLAELYRAAGKHDQALKYLDRTLTLSRAAKKVRNEANALSEIAIVYASQKRPNEARNRLRKALEFYERIGDRRGQAIALNRYGQYLLSIGQNTEALDAYNQALPVSEEIKDTTLLTDTLLGIARANNLLKNYDAALATLERSTKIVEELRAEVGTPDLRALYFSGVIQHYDLCRDILMDLDGERPGQGFAARAFLMSEKSRARSLLDRVRESQSRLREGATAELLAREREVGGLILTLADYQMGLPFDPAKDRSEREEVSRRLAQLRSDYQEIEVQLRAQNSKQAPLENFAVTDVNQIQQELRASNRMLLQYALGDQQSYLWAIAADSFQSYKLAPRRDLEEAAREVSKLLTARQNFDPSAINDYRANVESADNLYAEKARALSQILLGPVSGQLKNRRLIVVTEGGLHSVQFEALPLPNGQATGPIRSEEFLIKTSEIVALPSMTTLLAMRAEKRAPSPGKVVAIIADPVLTRNDERVNGKEQASGIVRTASIARSEQPLLRDGPSRLVYAAEEADAIVAVAPRGSTMLAKGFDASRETAMSPDIGEYQIVHFATHGILNSEEPEFSGILLTKVDQNGVERNGLMALHDIYTLDLSAELTVLSACQTALGKDVKGEGNVGLTHSFMSAGSKSVVSSLWKVEDRATASLMSDFYDAMLRQGVPPVAALRAAKLKMMEDPRWQAPYYWAGFVFQGDYDSRINLENNRRFVMVLGVLFIALVSFLLLVFLRRRRR